MPTKSVQTLAASNVDIFNAVRNSASLEYQQRIPDATKGNIQQSFENLLNYKPAMNEFVDTLVNRIGMVVYKSKVWDNPLAQFNRGMLNYGDTVEEIATDLIKAKRYDPNVCYEDVFKCSKPDVWTNFHKVNRQDMYELTLNQSLLRRAFTNDTGLSELINSLMTTPTTSDNWDTYLIAKQLFAEYARKDGYYKVNVPDISKATTQAQKRDMALEITEKVRSMAGKMRFISTEYNAAGVPTFTNKADLILFVTPDFSAMLDVNVIAFAFNASAADINLRVIEIDDFGIDGAQAILCDKDFLMIMDTLYDTESIRNPKALSWNYFMHHWSLNSVSRFVNAVLFTTEPGTTITKPTIATTGLTVAYAPVDGKVPTNAVKGENTRLMATVAGTVTPKNDGVVVPQGVAWSISDVTGGQLSTGTFIDAEGVLHVDADESATDVTVTAVSAYINPNEPASSQTYQSGQLKVTIVDPA